jgi:hypothetical protein
MGSRLTHRIIPTVAALALVAAPAVQASASGSAIDYSKNGATGQYVPQTVHKNYSLNGSTGDYRPALKSAPLPSPVAPVADQGAFSWGDAALGAAIALAAALLVLMTTRRIRRRRISAPSPARPTTV